MINGAGLTGLAPWKLPTEVKPPVGSSFPAKVHPGSTGSTHRTTSGWATSDLRQKPHPGSVEVAHETGVSDYSLPNSTYGSASDRGSDPVSDDASTQQVEQTEAPKKKATKAREFSEEQKQARAAAERERTQRRKLVAALDKYEDFRYMESAHLQLAATLLGCSADAKSVTIAAVMPPAGASSPSAVAELIDQLRADDPMDALVAAAGIAEDKPMLRGVWSLLGIFLPDLSERVPTGDNLHVGRDLARAAARLSDDDLQTVQSVLSTLR